MINIRDNREPTQDEFIRAYAKAMADWGMPLTAGRVLAYLLLQSKPTDLDQIAAGLGISRASAWGAARHLEQVNQIERFGEPGTKRAYFAPTKSIVRSMLNYSRLLSRVAALMHQGAALAGEGSAADDMRERAAFYLTVHDAIEATVDELIAAPAKVKGQ